MIPYSLNTGVRKQVIVILVLISVCITVGLENGVMQFFIVHEFRTDFYNNIYSTKAFELLIAIIIPPFIVCYLANIIYSKIIWKWPCCQLFHHIPNLNGIWEGYTFNDKNPTLKRRVSVIIKQDWYTILIRTEIVDANNNSDVQSFCECTVSSIDFTNGEVTLKYAYKNVLLGAKSYVGYNELRIEKNRIVGQYITTKPTKGVFDIYKR